ncbi:MAG TPA: group I intron-associated PD-(D/E)XK endonuclease [Acidimicrobiia bacterium]|nr:group I intron-associated PD-(D/E)XK endonuclease [Acidimicrobiia bacterium]HLF60186.1 group I intron-associated PD-(D/E)XK endonuclease [Acidimicrobiia bacterium]
MGITTAKGEVGEAIILADLQRQGHGVAIPFGHDLPYDLIVVRKEDGNLERVQCKYTTSNGRVILAKVTSDSAWVKHRYTGHEVDWIAVYDATTDQCLYIPSCEWDGLAKMNLRLTPASNGQLKRIRFASRYRELTGDPHDRRTSGSAPPLPLTLDIWPE